MSILKVNLKLNDTTGVGFIYVVLSYYIAKKRKLGTNAFDKSCKEHKFSVFRPEVKTTSDLQTRDSLNTI